MKRILFIILLLISFAYAQNPLGVPSQVAGKWLGGKGYISSDSGFFSLYRDTINKPLSGYWDIRWQGSTPYIWSGSAYSPFGGVSSVSGTTNRITSTGGTNPVIDISPSYVGQASITTLGTVGSGVWNATPITVPYGGTGVSSVTANSIPSGAGTSAINNNNNLFWDATNNRLGIGTSTPTHALTLDSIRGFNNGLSLNRFTDQTTNFMRLRLYTSSSNSGVYNIETGGTQSGGFHDFKISGTTIATIDGVSLTMSGNLYFSGSRDIGRNNAGSPLWPRDIYLQRSFQVGVAAGSAITAKIHVGAGTATAGTAPFKYTAGTNLTTPENGAKEFNGTNEFITAGGVRYTLAKTLTNTASLDYPSVAAGTTETLTITVTGAADGDVVALGVPIASQNTGLLWNAYVSAADTVTVSVTNTTITPIEPATATFRVSVLKY